MKIIQIAGGDENSYPWALDSEGNVYEWYVEGSHEYNARMDAWTKSGTNDPLPPKKQGWKLQFDNMNI